MTSQATPGDPLEATARWTAAVRARESAREDPLFDDPWAAALAGPEGMSWVEQRPADSVLPIALRTRYFDDWLQQVAGGGFVRQVVLMAAGLDTRAFRLAWPVDARCFELDQPEVLRHKEEILRSAAAEVRAANGRSGPDRAVERLARRGRLRSGAALGLAA